MSGALARSRPSLGVSKKGEQFFCREAPQFGFSHSSISSQKSKKVKRESVSVSPSGGAGGNIKSAFSGGFGFFDSLFSFSPFLSPQHSSISSSYLEQLLLRDVLGQVRCERLDPNLLAGLHFRTHVGLRVSAGSDEHDGEARSLAPRGRDELFHSGCDLSSDGGSDGLAVDDGCGAGGGGFGCWRRKGVGFERGRG